RSFSDHHFLLCPKALMCDKPTVVSGTEGQMFDFICEYPSDSKNNTKHFCCLDIDESFGQVVRTSKHNEWTREGRVSLYDNTTAGYFIVRLDKLYLNDSGKYHCGDFGSSDRIMKIHLHVSQGKVQNYNSTLNVFLLLSEIIGMQHTTYKFCLTIIFYLVKKKKKWHKKCCLSVAKLALYVFDVFHSVPLMLRL
uniref:Ig-like domain-containing protein n=1 Tax=Poecilia mexicana TaxID=48701 RepID=A0A3B3Y8T1_9TELE